MYLFSLLTPQELLNVGYWTYCEHLVYVTSRTLKCKSKLFEEFAIRKRHTMKFATSRLRIIQNDDTSIMPAWCRIIYPGSIYPGSIHPGSIYPGSICPGSIYPGSKMGNSCKKILMAKEIELLKHDP